MEELEKKNSEILKFETYKEDNKSGVNQEVEEEKMALEENGDRWDIYLQNLDLNDSNEKKKKLDSKQESDDKKIIATDSKMKPHRTLNKHRRESHPEYET